MTRPSSFEEVLANIVDLLERIGIRSALIGGLAVATWGSPRATEDIDLLAELAPSAEVESAAQAEGWRTSWRRGGAGDPIPLLLRLEWLEGGPEVEVICATRAWERAMLHRAVPVVLPDGLRVSVVAPADLIILKLLAGGPQGLIDVADLLRRCSPMAGLEDLAAGRGDLDLLEQVRKTMNTV
jgi:hypothetical protein